VNRLANIEPVSVRLFWCKIYFWAIWENVSWYRFWARTNKFPTISEHLYSRLSETRKLFRALDWCNIDANRNLE